MGGSIRADRWPRGDRPRGQRFLRRADLSGCEGGAAILEFALALPIILLLLAGCYEVGRALLVRQQMVVAVRAGARFLARVPDPTCRPTCSPGAAHAVAMTVSQIADQTGVAPDTIRVTPLAPSPDGTVTMRAEVRLPADLSRVLDLGAALTLQASHRERRVAE